MRALTIALIAAGLIGCNPEISTPESETVGSLAPQDTTESCYGTSINGAQPLQDRWNGQRGFILWHILSGYCNTMFENDYGVVGFDSTMTQVIFTTEVADMNGVDYYRNLPGTIACSYLCDAGQVGSANTNTGGNHQCRDTVCFPLSEMVALHNQCCQTVTQQQACSSAGATCGDVSNGCGGTYSCGTCPGGTCEDGTCVRNCPGICPVGTYRSADSCVCIKGFPM